MNPPPRGCSTCQGRKIRCDRTLPSCTRCLRSGLPCGGYHVRLYWPNVDNHRRAMTVSHSAAVEVSGKLGFVQSTVWDMELHYHLNSGRMVTKETRSNLNHFLKPRFEWMPHKVGHTDKQLIQYFESTAFLALTTLGVDPHALRNTLLRMALSSNTSASEAVLQSLLALSSLHRHGPQTRALQHKGAALEKLSQSIIHGVEGREAFQNSAAGMLLCAFEVQQIAYPCRDWTWYVCGSRNIIKQAIRDNPSLEDDDSAALLGWIHYFDVLARFNSRHWRDSHADDKAYMKNSLVNYASASSVSLLQCFRKGAIADLSKVPYPTTLSHKVLQLMAEIIECVVDPSDPRYQTDEYWKLIEKLKRGLKHATMAPEALTESENSAFKITKLYQLAAQIYLERALVERPKQSENIRVLLDEAFDRLEHLETCPWPLPVLIIGYEAQSEERRRVIMDLIFRTQNNVPMKNLGCLTNLLRVSWTQDDLAQRNIRYVDRLSRIMSLSEVAPILV